MNQHTDLDIGPMREDEFERTVALVAQAIGLPFERMYRPWIKMGYRQGRVARKRGKVVAALGLISMGQWFGGVSIPTGGITAVGVAPEYRGSGVGLALLRHTLEELHITGVSLSSLYPATVTFYRRLGYERAATRTVYEMPTRAITIRQQEPEVVEVEPADYAKLRQIYRERARRTAGNLDRPDYFWEHYLEPPDKTAYKYMVLRDDQPEGYIIFTQSDWNNPLSISDICFLTRDAGRRLLALLAAHRSTIKTVQWAGGAYDPLIFLTPESQHTVTSSLDLMLRIVDVTGALTARGYPPELRAELHLEIHDELLPWNNGHFTLEIDAGKATVHSGGAGRVCLGVRELAMLYSGYLTPLEVQSVGAITAPEQDLLTMSQVFAGPRPWIPDMF
ncbi:MAG: enhanced intracellular survival protein Eis [Chloroflexaceae bacterium]